MCADPPRRLCTHHTLLLLLHSRTFRSGHSYEMPKRRKSAESGSNQPHELTGIQRKKQRLDAARTIQVQFAGSPVQKAGSRTPNPEAGTPTMLKSTHVISPICKMLKQLYRPH